jgi:hypothetical protein
MTGESLPRGIPLAKQAAISMVGSVDSLFNITDDPELEFIIGVLPQMDIFDELDLPPELDCDLILEVYFGAGGSETKPSPQEVAALAEEMKRARDAENAGDDGGDETSEGGEEQDPNSPSSGSGGGDGTGADAGAGGEGAGDDEDAMTDEGDEDELDDFKDTDYRDCAKIELGWLKILLVIAKIIKILAKIIDFVLGIVMPIIAIIQLAVGAWLNPTNIAKIAQIVAHMVIAIIIMMIAMIIQMIWDLLNLDCIADQVESLIQQIREALSAFSSLASAFNPTAVALLMDKVNKSVLDPFMNAYKTLEEDAKGWKEQIAGVKDMFSKDNRDKMVSALTSSMKSALLNDPNLGRAASIAQNMKDLVQGENSPLNQAKNALAALQTWKSMKAGFRTPGMKTDAEKLITSPQFVGMTLTRKDTE